MARPRKPIDPEQVRRLAAINCSYEEISSVVGCDPSTLTRRFAQVIKEGREQGKASLKRMMWDSAQKGSNTMMIWLSKQLLGYTDKVEQRLDAQVETNNRGMTPQELDNVIKSDPILIHGKKLQKGNHGPDHSGS